MSESSDGYLSEPSAALGRPRDKKRPTKKSAKASQISSSEGSLATTDGHFRRPVRRKSKLFLKNSKLSEPTSSPFSTSHGEARRTLHGRQGSLLIQKKDSLAVMREDSVDLDASSNNRHNNHVPSGSSDLEEKTTPKRFANLILQPTNSELDSIDLEDVEVLRNKGQRAIQRSPSPVERSELDALGEDHVIELDIDVTSRPVHQRSAVAKMFTADVLAMHNEIELDCGQCSDLDTRVCGLEHQLTALRNLVRTLGEGGQDYWNTDSEDSMSAQKGKSNWKDRIFGATSINPLAERQRLLREREELHKATNFLFRKMDESESKRRKN